MYMVPVQHEAPSRYTCAVFTLSPGECMCLTTVRVRCLILYMQFSNSESFCEYHVGGGCWGDPSKVASRVSIYRVNGNIVAREPKPLFKVTDELGSLHQLTQSTISESVFNRENPFGLLNRVGYGTLILFPKFNNVSYVNRIERNWTDDAILICCHFAGTKTRAKLLFVSVFALHFYCFFLN